MEEKQLIEKFKVAGIVSIRDFLLEMQAKGEKIARTESGDPSFDIPENVKVAIEKALRENKTHYTAGAGINELRDAIYEKVKYVNKININSRNSVMVTNGAMNALYTIFHAINNNEGVSMLVPSPTWTETAQNISEVGGTPIYYNFNPFSDAPIDIDELEVLFKIYPNIKAMVINSPHNPTGKILDLAMILKVVGFCKAHDIYLISDEAYEHIIFDNLKHVSPGQLDYDKIISIFSFSKSYAMSGLRLGCACTNDPIILKRLSKIIRCTINGVNSVTQWGGVSAILETPSEYIEKNLEEYTKRRDAIYEAALNNKYLEPVKPEGTFYLWCKIKNEWKPEIVEDRGWHMILNLLKLGAGSAPGEVFGPEGKNHIRFSFSCSMENVLLASELLNKLE